MEVIRVAGAALAAAMLLLLLRELRGSMVPPVRAICAAALFAAAASMLTPILSRVRALAALGGEETIAAPLLRVLAVALVCEFAASLCRDLGEQGLSEGVLFFGRVEILLLCLPLADEIVTLAKELLAL